MAPAVGLGHAATALSLLALGLNVETRFRAGGLLTAQLSEPEPELTLCARIRHPCRMGAYAPSVGRGRQ